MLKICKECLLEKPYTEFYKSPAYKDGLCHRCKECTKIYDKTMIARIKEKETAKSKKCCRCNQVKDSIHFHKRARNSDGLRSECIECTRLLEKDYRIKHLDQGYYAKIRQKYNISPEEHQALIADNDGKCAICKEDTKLVIDHSHLTHRVRGLLCSRCNAGLGMFGDKKELLQEAINYLEKADEQFLRSLALS